MSNVLAPFFNTRFMRPNEYAEFVDRIPAQSYLSKIFLVCSQTNANDLNYFYTQRMIAYLKEVDSDLEENYNNIKEVADEIRLWPSLAAITDEEAEELIRYYNYAVRKFLPSQHYVKINNNVLFPKDDLEIHKEVLSMEDIGKKIQAFDKDNALKFTSQVYNEGKIQLENDYDDIKEEALDLLKNPIEVEKSGNSNLETVNKSNIFCFGDVNRTKQGKIDNIFIDGTDIQNIIKVLSNYNVLIINDQISDNYLSQVNNFSINKINVIFDIARIPIGAGEKTTEWVNYLKNNPLNNFSYVQFHLPFNTIFTKLRPLAASADKKVLAGQICQEWRNNKIFTDIMSKIDEKKQYYRKLIVESAPGILSENILKKLFKVDKAKPDDFKVAYDNIVKILSTFGMTRIYTNFIFPALEALKLALSPGIYEKDEEYIVDFKTIQLPTVFFGLFMKFKKEILKDYHIGKVKIEKTSTRDQIKVKRDGKTYDEQDEIREKQKRANAENDLSANVRSKNDLSKTHVLCSVEFSSIDNIIKNFVDLICIFPFDIKFNCFDEYKPVNIINYSEEDYTKKFTIKDQVSIYMKSLGFTNGDILGKIMFITDDGGAKLYKIEFNYNSIVKRWIKIYKHKDIIKFINKADFPSYMFYYNIFDMNLLKSIDDQMKKII